MLLHDPGAAVATYACERDTRQWMLCHGAKAGVTHWRRRQRQRGIITAVPRRPPLADEGAKCVIPVEELLEFHQPRQRCVRRSAGCGVSTTETGGALAHGGASVRSVSAKRCCDCERQGETGAVIWSDGVVVVVVVSEKRVGVEGKVL